MNDFYLRLAEGLGYSFLISFLAILICVPISLGVALLLRERNPLARLSLYSLDIFIALPNQILLLTLAGLLGGGFWALLLSVFMTQVPTLIRHFRVHLKRAFAMNHVEAARGLGVGPLRLFFLHVIPRLWAPLSVATVSLMKRVILSETLLSFLGLGFDPLTPSLGRLISEGRDALFVNPVYFLAPILVLFLCLFTLQNVSDRYSTLFRTRGIRYL